MFLSDISDVSLQMRQPEPERTHEEQGPESSYGRLLVDAAAVLIFLEFLVHSSLKQPRHKQWSAIAMATRAPYIFDVDITTPDGGFE